MVGWPPAAASGCARRSAQAWSPPLSARRARRQTGALGRQVHWPQSARCAMACSHSGTSPNAHPHRSSCQTRGGAHNGRKVVVGEDHVGGVLGDRSAGAHGDADVGALERGRIVHAVARHCHHVPLRAARNQRGGCPALSVRTSQRGSAAHQEADGPAALACSMHKAAWAASRQPPHAAPNRCPHPKARHMPGPVRLAANMCFTRTQKRAATLPARAATGRAPAP